MIKDGAYYLFNEELNINTNSGTAWIKGGSLFRVTDDEERFIRSHERYTIIKALNDVPELIKDDCPVYYGFESDPVLRLGTLADAREDIRILIEAEKEAGNI